MVFGLKLVVPFALQLPIGVIDKYEDTWPTDCGLEQVQGQGIEKETTDTELSSTKRSRRESVMTRSQR